MVGWMGLDGEVVSVLVAATCDVIHFQIWSDDKRISVLRLWFFFIFFSLVNGTTVIP